jgi:hypothetical protein
MRALVGVTVHDLAAKCPGARREPPLQWWPLHTTSAPCLRDSPVEKLTHQETPGRVDRHDRGLERGGAQAEGVDVVIDGDQALQVRGIGRSLLRHRELRETGAALRVSMCRHSTRTKIRCGLRLQKLTPMASEASRQANNRSASRNSMTDVMPEPASPPMLASRARDIASMR